MKFYNLGDKTFETDFIYHWKGNILEIQIHFGYG